MMGVAQKPAEKAKFKAKTQKKAPAKAASAPPAAAPPATVRQAARAYREKGGAGTRAALVAMAQRNARTEQGALAQLALATIDLDRQRPAEALSVFVELRRRLPALADFANYGAGRALAQLGRKAEAVAVLDAVARHQPESPYRVWAVILAANCRTETGAAAEAVARLRPLVEQLPQPQGKMALARALEATGDTKGALPLLLEVYSEWPRSAEAAAALGLLTSRALPVPGEIVLRRAEKLFEQGGAAEAGAELREALPKLPAKDRDLARVRLGAAKYFGGQHLAAYEYLNALAVAAGEADAERLYYVLSAARRLERWEAVDGALRQLNERYPKSPWRLEGLLSVANRHLVNNEPELYLPLYQACYSSFPQHPKAAFCHWRVAWIEYLQRAPTAEAMLQEHVLRYPQSPDTPAAIYFLARLEEDKDVALARGLYETLAQVFPNYYYGVLARERLAQPALRQAGSSSKLGSRVEKWKLARAAPPPSAADAVSAARIERARLLAAAGLAEEAELELRFGARTDSRPVPLAVEAARIAQERGALGQALRNVKAMTPAYLNWNLDAVPAAYWKAAFPLHFQASLESHSAAQALDPLLVAALIRQESEFEPTAKSRARAMGLTQIMPATGRELSRRLGIPWHSPAQLYQPDFNVRLGTFFLRRIADSFNGHWEATLAAYNAGPTRARRWMDWGSYREPAEFVESIPFHETRNYVQSVIRNADVYRRLYSSPPVAIPSNLGNNSFP
jgi:soluble lytic murein transglycosylase